MSVVLLVTVQWYQVMSSCVSQHEIGVRPPDTNNCEFTAASATPQLYIFLCLECDVDATQPGVWDGLGHVNVPRNMLPKIT